MTAARLYSIDYVGPRRRVTDVFLVKRKRGDGQPKYVIEMECGHRERRQLWRECDYSRCRQCRREKEAKLSLAAIGTEVPKP